ncbi:hypothetical protein GW17_00034898 [Ensete ventricosum]|nr:hypothetical protein GW17_00034898 [Ensete ventricosum]
MVQYPVPNGTHRGDGSRDARRNPGSPLLLLFFFLPASVDFARNRSATIEIDRYRSISRGNRRKQSFPGGTARWRAVHVSINLRSGMYHSIQGLTTHKANLD